MRYCPDVARAASIRPIERQRSRIVIDDSAVVVRGAGDVVARRSLEFYDALGGVMAVKGNA
jgi:hypothetical protein